MFGPTMFSEDPRRDQAPRCEMLSSAKPLTPPERSSGGVADHFVTLMLRQGDAEASKRYSQTKLDMMREASTDWTVEPTNMKGVLIQ